MAKREIYKRRIKLKTELKPGEKLEREGISAHVRTTYGPEDWQTMPAPTVADDIKLFEDWAKATLRAAGMPDHLRPVAWDGRHWHEVKAPGKHKVYTGAMLAHATHDPTDPVCNAADALLHVRGLREALKKGDAEGAAYNAMRMVHHAWLGGFRLNFEADVVNQRRLNVGRSKGGKRRRWYIEPLRQAIEQMLRDNPGASTKVLWRKMDDYAVDGVTFTINHDDDLDIESDARSAVIKFSLFAQHCSAVRKMLKPNFLSK